MAGIHTLGQGERLCFSVWVLCFFFFFSVCESLEWICGLREGVHGHGENIFALFCSA